MRFELSRVHGIVLGAALALSGAAAQAKPQQLTILSGPQGSGWYAIGGGIASLFTREGLRANSEVGGAITNLIQLSRGDAEAGFTFAAAATLAKKGEAPFPGKIENIRSLLTFQPSVVHVLLSQESGVKSAADLKGRKFASQAPGNLSQLAFANLLEAHGLKEADLDITRGSQTFGGDCVKDRRCVGVTAFSGVPGPMFMEVATAIPVKFLSVPDETFAKLKQINPGYTRAVIPAGTYPGQTEEVPSFGTVAMMVVNESMSEEDAYYVVKTLGDRLEDLRSFAAANKTLTLEQMADTPGVELHPGAARYYKEAGVLK